MYGTKVERFGSNESFQTPFGSFHFEMNRSTFWEKMEKCILFLLMENTVIYKNSYKWN